MSVRTSGQRSQNSNKTNKGKIKKKQKKNSISIPNDFIVVHLNLHEVGISLAGHILEHVTLIKNYTLRPKLAEELALLNLTNAQVVPAPRRYHRWLVDGIVDSGHLRGENHMIVFSREDLGAER